MHIGCDTQTAAPFYDAPDCSAPEHFSFPRLTSTERDSGSVVIPATPDTNRDGSRSLFKDFMSSSMKRLQGSWRQAKSSLRHGSATSPTDLISSSLAIDSGTAGVDRNNQAQDSEPAPSAASVCKPILRAVLKPADAYHEEDPEAALHDLAQRTKSKRSVTFHHSVTDKLSTNPMYRMTLRKGHASHGTSGGSMTEGHGHVQYDMDSEVNTCPEPRSSGRASAGRRNDTAKGVLAVTRSAESEHRLSLPRLKTVPQEGIDPTYSTYRPHFEEVQESPTTTNAAILMRQPTPHARRYVPSQSEEDEEEGAEEAHSVEAQPSRDVHGKEERSNRAKPRDARFAEQMRSPRTRNPHLLSRPKTPFPPSSPMLNGYSSDTDSRASDIFREAGDDAMFLAAAEGRHRLHRVSTPGAMEHAARHFSQDQDSPVTTSEALINRVRTPYVRRNRLFADDDLDLQGIVFGPPNGAPANGRRLVPEAAPAGAHDPSAPYTPAGVVRTSQHAAQQQASTLSTTATASVLPHGSEGGTAPSRYRPQAPALSTPDAMTSRGGSSSTVASLALPWGVHMHDTASIHPLPTSADRLVTQPHHPRLPSRDIHTSNSNIGLMPAHAPLPVTHGQLVPAARLPQRRLSHWTDDSFLAALVVTTTSRQLRSRRITGERSEAGQSFGSSATTATTIAAAAAAAVATLTRSNSLTSRTSRRSFHVPRHRLSEQGIRHTGASISAQDSPVPSPISLGETLPAMIGMSAAVRARLHLEDCDSRAGSTGTGAMSHVAQAGTPSSCRVMRRHRSHKSVHDDDDSAESLSTVVPSVCGSDKWGILPPGSPRPGAATEEMYVQIGVQEEMSAASEIKHHASGGTDTTSKSPSALSPVAPDGFMLEGRWLNRADSRTCHWVSLLPHHGMEYEGESGVDAPSPVDWTAAMYQDGGGGGETSETLHRLSRMGAADVSAPAGRRSYTGSIGSAAGLLMGERTASFTSRSRLARASHAAAAAVAASPRSSTAPGFEQEAVRSQGLRRAAAECRSPRSLLRLRSTGGHSLHSESSYVMPYSRSSMTGSEASVVIAGLA